MLPEEKKWNTINGTLACKEIAFPIIICNS